MHKQYLRQNKKIPFVGWVERTAKQGCWISLRVRATYEKMATKKWRRYCSALPTSSQKSPIPQSNLSPTDNIGRLLLVRVYPNSPRLALPTSEWWPDLTSIFRDRGTIQNPKSKIRKRGAIAYYS